ncbi:MAG: hypothetical protein J6P82_01990 [Bacteroidales bacterium]|nr:hypothetical protein [Bacteroidales bacterium]MBP5213755.1 hypothetical protein [Bacteroidales bacterium]
MKNVILSFLLLVAGILPSMADNITVDGTNRTYNVYAPNNLGQNRPLLIFCHGYGQDANWMQNTEFKNDNVSMEAVCDTAKFVVVFPNGISNSWDISGDRDINFIKAIIDKMVTQYNIDRNRVYMGGFSMGGMLTYHAMNKIPDLIAAFCPVSGYPMGGATANANVRPIPILHIHGTSDETCGFSGVQPALNVWINHNGCPTTDKVVSNYNGFNGAKMHIWGPGTNGVEVRLLELPNKGHWICKEPQVYTGKEIWNFCQRFSLEKTTPNVRITSPNAGVKYISYAPSGQAQFPDVTITASADDPNGTIEKVEFFDGTNLLATCTEAPYETILSEAKTGTHTIKAVATDNDGETSSATIAVMLLAPSSQTLSSAFTTDGIVPAGWSTFDGSEQRSGLSKGLTSGCRVLQFTGSPRGVNYGLYFRNIEGKPRQGWAKYGNEANSATINLYPGHYTLKYKICNWNKPDFSPVELSIEKRASGESVASQTYMPNVNIGNSVSNCFGTLEQKIFEFDITEPADYVIALYTADTEWGDCVLGQLILAANSYIETGIEDIYNEAADARNRCFDLQGRPSSGTKGITIRNGKKTIRL